MIWLIPLVLIVVLAGLSTWNRRRWQEWFDARVQALAEQGVSVSPADLEQEYILPEDVANGADVYLEAFSLYREPTESEKKCLPYLADHTPPENSEKIPHETMDAILLFLNKNKQTVELLVRAGQMRYCLWPKVRDGNCYRNTYLYEIKNAVKLLRMLNLYFSEKQHSDMSFASLRTLLSLGQSLKIQADLADHRVGAMCNSVAADSLNVAMNRGCFDAQQLACLQNEYFNSQHVTALYHALVVHRVAAIEFFRLPFRQQYWLCSGPLLRVLKLWSYCSGMIQKDANLYLQYLDAYLEALRLPLHERAPTFHKIDEQRQRFVYMHVYPERVSDLADVNRIDLRVIGQLRCAETALAIQQYRLRFKSLPGSLEELVPDFMDRLPREPFDGCPLHYIRHEDGFAVYAVGEDGVDNGKLSEEQTVAKTGHENPEQYDWPFTVKW